MLTNDRNLKIMSYDRDRLLAEQDRVDEALSQIPGSEQGTPEYERLVEEQTALEAALDIQGATQEPNPVPVAILMHPDGTKENASILRVEHIPFTDPRSLVT